MAQVVVLHDRFDPEVSTVYQLVSNLSHLKFQ